MNKQLAASDLFNNYDAFTSFLGSHKDTTYPPFNIWKDSKGNYGLEMAVAGFTREDIQIQFDGRFLNVQGQKQENTLGAVQYINHGIAAREFTRTFEVRGSFEAEPATLKDGILSVVLRTKAVNNQIEIL